MHILLNQCEHVPFYKYVRGKLANRIFFKICIQGGANSVSSFIQIMFLQCLLFSYYIERLDNVCFNSIYNLKKYPKYPL
jgi:hypothetical protein